MCELCGMGIEHRIAVERCLSGTRSVLEGILCKVLSERGLSVDALMLRCTCNIARPHI